MQTPTLTAAILGLSALLGSTALAQTLQISPLPSPTISTLHAIEIEVITAGGASSAKLYSEAAIDTAVQMRIAGVDIVVGEALLSLQNDTIGAIKMIDLSNNTVTVTVTPSIQAHLSQPVDAVRISADVLERLDGALSLPISSNDFAVLINASMGSHEMEVY